MKGKYKIEAVEKDGKTYYIIRDENYQVIQMASKYLVYLSKTMRSPNTARQRGFALCYYLSYLDNKNITLSDVLSMSYMEQDEHFQSFITWLKAGLHKSSSKVTGNNTCLIYLNAVFAWYGFISMEYCQNALKISEKTSRNVYNSVGVGIKISGNHYHSYIRRQDTYTEAISRDDIQTLLSCTTNIRDKLLILLLADTGARIGEVLGIRYTQDIDFSKKQIRVTYREDNINNSRAKNEENRTLYVSDDTFDILQVYLAEYKELLSQTDYLFIVLEGSTKGQPLDVGAVYAMFRRLKKKTGIHVTPHQFRRYYANERRKEKWPIEEIACAMGHRNTSTTERYFIVGDDEKSRASQEYFAKTGALYNIDEVLG